MKEPGYWIRDHLPDFEIHGFHNKDADGNMLHVEFMLNDGTTLIGPYQGWAIFGSGRGYDWLYDEPQDSTPRVVAWRPL